MIVSFDIGGTTIRGAAFEGTEAMGPVQRSPTPAHDFPALLAALRQIIALSSSRPSGLAISIAGVTDPDTGRAICANIPCIHGRRLKEELERELALPVAIANDADCFALAEALLGAGRGQPIVFGAVLGTGVGGGLVANGRLVNAGGGFAGEWGHGPSVPHFAGEPAVAVPSFACGCGQQRCLDSVGGARGLERLHELIHGKQIHSEEIVAEWEQGGKEAARTLDVFLDIVSAALAVVVNVTGAGIVPLGGGLSNAQRLVDSLDERVRTRTLRRFDRPLVVRAACKIEPGLAGAALIGFSAAGMQES